MSGFGIARYGTAPYGLGTPLTAAGNEGNVLADDTGKSQGSRVINSRTRRYEFDENGRAKGQINTQALVQLALLTVLGSSAMPRLGEEPSGGVIGANFAQKRKASIQSALADLVRRKLISVVSIEVDTKRKPIFTLVRWRDLTTDIEQQIAI